MNKTPLISIVIPFYSNIAWLIEAVQSVLAQTYKNYEIIIINDGSSEDTSMFLEKYNDRIIYVQKENAGPASARNLGIKIATGEYVAFLDSDDIWLPNKLQIQISEMLDKSAKWSQTSYEQFGNGKENEKINVISNPKLFRKMLFVSNRIATPTVIVKREVLLEEKVFFLENRRYGEDTELWMRLSRKYDILSIDKALTKVRIRGTNAGLSAKVQLQSRAEIYHDIRDTDEVSYGLKINYKICNIMYKFLCYLTNTILRNKDFIEIIAGALYLVPYAIFKLYMKVYLKKYK